MPFHYWDNVLSPLAGRSSKPVLIKYDPRNLSRVFYRDKDGHYWPIPYRNLGAPPISLWEQREAMKRLRTQGRRLVDERLIFETALAQRKLVDSARKSTRKRRNKERLRSWAFRIDLYRGSQVWILSDLYPGNEPQDSDGMDSP